MLRVGLTGGIGAGKSAVSSRLAERGAVVIDSDVLAREVVARGTDGLAEVVDAFGPGVLTADGELDRPALGKIVFGDETARRKLEAIIHPRVRARAAEIEAGAAADAIVVHDIPLLVETGQADRFDVVLVVDVPVEVQVQRLTAQRGMTDEEAKQRIASQASRDDRLAAADVVVGNSGSLADLDRRLDEVWDTLEHRQGHGPDTKR
ncbi:dephospho-CoA kinase [Kribbella sp. VKM Ac-2569]|uniref:dephospho-CoA kinase n=1 Tax=Kribbella sp. VKM Ac-2569 TaxID=2512220 RepID=UPI00102B2F4C|nr:dephospho-CoA kinase [Kribbella sp. VKM Ac-2569]RZT26418.1 dephospho-CoA kinase [Kribbella sp. VKM Ac-2569]